MKKWLTLVVAATLLLGVGISTIAKGGSRIGYGEEPCDCGTDPETGGCLPCEDFDE